MKTAPPTNIRGWMVDILNSHRVMHGLQPLSYRDWTTAAIGREVERVEEEAHQGKNPWEGR